ncbi:MAG: hypothetical protein IT442_04535 [Phycisphaeraceae bacterium]|nr:hypothetical protein [Phycisphaeraceae bacterium]
MVKKMLTGLAVVALAVWTGSAMAGTVDMKFLGWAKDGGGAELQELFKYKVGSSSRETQAGIFQWQRVGGTQAGAPAGLFQTVCIELDQYVASTVYDVIAVEDGPKPGSLLTAGPMGVAKADMLSKLWAAYWDVAQANSANAAAFQVSVWEIVYDGDTDLASGDFRHNYGGGPLPAFVSTAQTWLDALPGLLDETELVALSNQRFQDQLTSVVPLTPAAWGGLALLAGLGIARLRKRQTA